MTTPTITPVLLCGGSGTRLWPLSRRSYPKQFAPLTGPESLFQSSARRLSAPGFAPPLAVTGEEFRFIVGEQLRAIGIEGGTILIEPAARNTAPAVLAAALWLERTDPDGLMLVAPSDHEIRDPEGFRQTVLSAVPAAQEDGIVTFGIVPTRPETGYGWLEPEAASDAKGPAPLRRFVEKPDLETAERMLADGGYLWNAGVFLFSVRAIIAAFEKHAPQLMPPVRDAVGHVQPDLDFHRLDAEAWAKAEDISIDYAVMEKAERLYVQPWAGHWSDLGGWDAVWREAGPDETGVVTSGAATAIDCSDTLLRAEDPTQEVVGLGLKNMLVVATSDAVLVADADRAQEVRRAVDALKTKGAAQATQHPKHHRPWGWFETLVMSDRFQVKRIVVRPGATLSLQSHVHRAEHWVVVSGTAKVRVGDDEHLLTENQSVFVPLGTVHRLENPGRVPMVLIEVQTGAYLGEDDIIRYEDVYDRV
ncbi:mannose-1-phosphate guanylyltransferase/mannose-6-phosphate isomerase [Pontivivens ytuae]|uniref:mannose-1-phosphate guanylyltransferase n=1 Tax=Pontivivens ytuae TaxID=2789856 RepID=A0A7S9LVD7_9RHOB|nr:mannose-1-phosphate guanylyltransferase/mannose-6-phosphate isomerase [Pontivivens ytuae]QPH55959.1 mannose-1-phosphate guanylyltransferase/mannose-6-phosphate isomerase [Pontivivens ytuae]